MTALSLRLALSTLFSKQHGRGYRGPRAAKVQPDSDETVLDKMVVGRHLTETPKSARQIAVSQSPSGKRPIPLLTLP